MAMEFTVNKADLVRELSLSQGVVEKKTTIPILSNVLVEAAGDRITLTATDLELGIRCSCPAQVATEGSGTIPARRLLDYVRLLPEAGINIKFADNHWANLLCGRSRTRIAGMSRESFPELAEMPEKIADIPVSVLQNLITRTIFSISSEESRFTLNGALLLFKADSLIMVATDGHRLALAQESVDFGEAEPSYRALLPKKAMAELLKLVPESGEDAVISFAGDENHLFFRSGDRLLMCRKLTGNFPDYERVLPAEQPHVVALNREEMRATIERVAQFSDERSHAIRLKFSPGEMHLHSSLSDTGETEESLPVTYDGPVVEVGFNAHYVGEFLRVVTNDEVTFGFRDGGSAGELRPVDGAETPSYRYVVMPMRI
jgi:DNA polymerase-3 subunit beta